jgi:hypothetical protein
VVVWFNTIGPSNNMQETYEYTQLPMCLGSKEVAHRHESIGQALLGIQLINSGMDIQFGGVCPYQRVFVKPQELIKIILGSQQK